MIYCALIPAGESMELLSFHAPGNKLLQRMVRRRGQTHVARVDFYLGRRKMAVAGDLLTNVVANFVNDGLKWGYHEIRGTVRRRHHIDRVLSGQAVEKDDRLEKAIKDLEVVIGSFRGELTESVAAFIREIHRSALPAAIIR